MAGIGPEAWQGQIIWLKILSSFFILLYGVSSYFRTTIISCFALILMTTAAFGNPKAGFMDSEVTNEYGAMAFTVWYPTSNKAKGPSTYDFFSNGSATPYLEEEWAQAGATRGAPIKGGTFPLIAMFPGANDPIDARWNYFPNAELLAAAGYIVVIPGRNTDDWGAQGPLLSGLINHMLDVSPLRDSIDASKIGAKGLSFGGLGVSSLAGGDVFGNAPDGRVSGIIIDEGAGVCNGLTDCTSVTIPVFFRDGGSLLDAPFYISDMAPEFAAHVNAFPRFLLTLDNVSHYSFATGACGVIEGARQISLIYQEDYFGYVLEPEPRNLSYLPIAFGIGDLSGQFAAVNWNLDTYFLALGYPIPDAWGSGGDGCEPEYGGPVTVPPGEVRLDEPTMIETLYATELGFWQMVFGDGNSDRTKLEKAVDKLDNVKSFVKVTE